MPRTPFPHLHIGPAFVAALLLSAGVARAQEAADSGTLPATDALTADATMLGEPGGAVIADVRRAAPVQLLEDGGGAWVRVRVEGWVSRDVLGPGAATPVVESASLAAIRATPDRYVGSRVRWNVQAVALQRADSLHSDMQPGESYLLVRDPDGELGFAYVVVPPPLIDRVSGLTPLQRIQVVATVRVGRSPLTGHPILDLVEVEY